MTTLEEVRILHVDDAPEFATLAAEMLEREDDRFTVDTASSASEGLDRLASHEFDCIVSDYEMPGTNGIDFLRAVREEYADLPFILFTGKGSEEIASDAISADVTDYLQKRSTSEQYELLANRIRNAVDRYEAERERRRWKRAVETANEGIAILDDEGRFLQMNEAYAGAYGRDPDELLGKTSRAVYPEEVSEWFQEEVHETLRRDGTWKGEAVGRRADGTEFEQQLSLAMLDDGGHVCVMEDITERRRRERELERQNERLTELIEKHEATETRYRTLFENAPIVVWEEDLSGVKERVDDLATEADDLEAYLEANRETLLSLADAIEIHDVNEYAVEHYDAPSKEALIENLDRIVTERSYEAYREEFLALAAGETQITIETQAQTFDGDLKDELLHVFVPEAYAGDYSCAYVTATDITGRKARERELERERKRLDTVVSNIPVVVFALDSEGVFTLSQGKGLEALGIEPGEVVGQSVFDIYEGHESLLSDIERALDGTRVTGTHEVQGLVFESTYEPVFDDDGTVKAVIGVSIDVTERKARERELRRYEAIVEAIEDGVYVVDEDGCLEYVNQGYAEMKGVDRAELLGTPIRQWVDDEQADRIYELVAELERDGRAEATLEYEFLAADGQRLPAELRFTDLEFPEGARGRVGVVRDITERKERERELRQQRERLREREKKLIRLRDYTQELMYAESTSETATIALRAVDEILGFDLGAVFTRSETQEDVLQLVEVLNRPRMEKMYGGLPAFLRDAPDGTHSALAWEVFESGESVFINDTAESDTLRRKSPFGSLMMYPIGRYGVVLLAATRMDAFTETEELLLDLLAAALETAFDRLEREHDLRRQRDELARQNERLDEFASVVSHDLRNPLTVAAGSLELASAECDSDHLDRVGQSLDRMRTLIDDLLTVAREGEPVGDLEPVAIAEVADACWETVATENATLDVETDVTVRADRSRLKQLFENLIRNAVEHGDADVTVTLRDGTDGFAVTDDGPGIPDDERDEVFDAGYSTTTEGTGFGLAIVEEIVEAHGWDIRVTDSQDGGARFEITGVETVD